LNPARVFLELAPITVGIVLTATGVLKAARPRVFRAHVSALGWIPDSLHKATVVSACFLEGFWGAALITGYRQSLLFPLSIFFFAVLSAISWIAVKSGRTEDCGCYGGVIRPSIYQSVGLNIVYSFLLALAWLRPASPDHSDIWRLAVAAAVATSFAAAAALRLDANSAYSPVSPLQPGKRWNTRWSGGRAINTNGEVLISFLGPECPHCKKWVKIANAMVKSPMLPEVLGVVSVDESRLRQFRDDHEIQFPLARVSVSRMLSLAPAVPTTVLVNDGAIERIWIGNMPADFSERFISAFFAKSEATV